MRISTVFGVCVIKNAPVEKKRRSGGRRNKCDTDIMEEGTSLYHFTVCYYIAR